MDMSFDPAAPMRPMGDPQQIWAQACTAAAVVASDPHGFGGLLIKAHAGPVREAYVRLFRSLLPTELVVRRLPSHISDERLIGGLDMAATLRHGRPVLQRGLMAEADHGVLIVPMAERLEPVQVSHLCSAMDRGCIDVQRDGLATQLDAHIGMLALDEGLGDEAVSPPLADRLAFWIDLRSVAIRDIENTDDVTPVMEADVDEFGSGLEACYTTFPAIAAAFGVSSVRATLFAIRAAKALARLDGRLMIEAEDIQTAAELVLAPRATQLPVDPSEPEEEEDGSPPNEPEPSQALDERSPPAQSDHDREDDAQLDGPLDDKVLDAVKASIPAQLLEQLRLESAVRVASKTPTSGKGAKKMAMMRGRPIGSRRGRLDGRHRLHVVDTLRTAAPWQRLRTSHAARPSRLVVTAEDVRVRRYKQNDESATIFVVDASGSSALHRLAEVKGAIELLLAESYARRDYVALVAFRGPGAELVLPATRSLVRARRCLAGLPGGGGTPLAAGLDAGLEVALECQRLGRTPRLVIMTDGQANVGYGSSSGRTAAHGDAMMTAGRIAASEIASLLVDTSPLRGGRRSSESRHTKAFEIADAMSALYYPLPQPNAEGLKELVSGAAAARLAS